MHPKAKYIETVSQSFRFQFFPVLLSFVHDDCFHELAGLGYYKTFVKDIYDSVMEALSMDPSRKFISVEVGVHMAVISFDLICTKILLCCLLSYTANPVCV